MKHQLDDFVRPRYANFGVWRVVAIEGDCVTAERKPDEFTREAHRTTATHDFFLNLEECEAEDFTPPKKTPLQYIYEEANLPGAFDVSNPQAL